MPLKRDSAKKYTSNPISGMGDLFGEPELPAGFLYIPDVISTADEKSLVQRFEKLPLKIFNPQTAPAAIIRSRSADEAAEKLAIELVRSPVRDPTLILTGGNISIRLASMALITVAVTVATDAVVLSAVIASGRVDGGLNNRSP